MNYKWFRYFLRECGDTTVGIINAKDEEDARQILRKAYTSVNTDNFVLNEVQFKNGCCELYYGG